MEQPIEKILNDVMTQPDTSGCLLANRQGLTLGGTINPKTSGAAVAIAEVAQLLEPNLDPPLICLYSGKKRLLLQKTGELTGVISKTS